MVKPLRSPIDQVAGSAGSSSISANKPAWPRAAISAE